MEVVSVTPRTLVFSRPGSDGGPAAGGSDQQVLVVRCGANALSGHPLGSAVAFKLQTNASRRFNVQPAQGYLFPGESKRVTVQLKFGAGWAETDKFLVRAAVVDRVDVPVESVWTSSEAKVVQKIVVRCDYTNDQQLPGKSATQSPSSTPNELAAITPRQRLMMIKNLSRLPEDELELHELRELSELRSVLGPDRWERLEAEVLAAAKEKPRVAPGQSASKPAKDPIEKTGTNRYALPARQSSSSTAATNATGPFGKPSPASPVDRLSGKLNLTDMLNDGVALLREGNAEQSRTVFSRALELTATGTVERAQVLVGLASAFEKGGQANKALDCNIAALQIFDRRGDRESKASVSNDIAHIHKDLCDYGMAAAWFEYELEQVGNEPGNGVRRSNIMVARDSQLRLGHITEQQLDACRGRVEAALLTSQSALDVLTTPNRWRSPDEAHVGGSTNNSASTGAHQAVEALWEPSRPGYSVASLRSLGSGSPTLGPTLKVAPRSSTGSFSSHQGSGQPHYLAPTRASRASRVSIASRKSSQQLDRAEPNLPSSSRSNTVSQVNPEAVHRRNNAAAAQHVQRSLEARRRRDQASGVKPPVLRGVGTTKQELEASPSDPILIGVNSQLDGEMYSVSIPGPISMVHRMTVRQIRERVKDVVGVELHDFELVVDGEPLLDSWTGGDIGIESGAEVELRLLPGVRKNKYKTFTFSKPPSNEGVRAVVHESPLHIDVTSQPAHSVPAELHRDSFPPRNLEEASPLPVHSASKDRAHEESNGLQSGGLENKDSYESEDDLERLAGSTAGDSGIGIYVDAVKQALARQQKRQKYADEIGQQALKLLKESDDEDEEEGRTGGDSSAENQTNLAAYTASLLERIVHLEDELAASQEAHKKTSAELELAKSRILDLSASSHKQALMRDGLQKEIANAKQAHAALERETKASLANFAEVLDKGLRKVQAAEHVQPILAILVDTEEEADAFDDEVADACLTKKDLSDSAWMQDMLEGFRDNVIDGFVDSSFLFSIGERLFFPKSSNAPSLMTQTVTKLFENLSQEELTSKLSAIALSSQTNGTVAAHDLLSSELYALGEEPGPQLDEHGQLELCSETVAIESLDSFSGLIQGIRPRLQRFSEPVDVIVMLENELTGRRLVFAQLCSNLVQTRERSKLPRHCQVILNAATVASAQAVIVTPPSLISGALVTTLMK